VSASPITFSLTMPRYEEPGARDPFRRTYEFAHHLESVGWSCGFVGHHSFTPETRDPSSPFVLLGAIAARTEQLRLGTGIFIGALHHPITVAEQVATLDQISGGRAVFGVGTGYRRYEFEAYGSPFERRGRRLDETLQIARSAWSTGSFAHDGELFHFPDLALYPPVVQRPHPPIYVGGTSPGAIERAARFGDAWFTLPMETLDYVRALADQYREACARHGTTPRICLMREAWVAGTDAAVEGEWFERALRFHRYYWETGTRGDHDDPVLQRVGTGQAVSYREFVKDRAFAGTPDVVIDELRRWHDAIGFDEVCLIFATAQEAVDPDTMTRATGLFAREVMPAFR
jgi:probable F420-dependent oxidoreductase